MVRKWIKIFSKSVWPEGDNLNYLIVAQESDAVPVPLVYHVYYDI